MTLVLVTYYMSTAVSLSVQRTQYYYNRVQVLYYGHSTNLVLRPRLELQHFDRISELAVILLQWVNPDRSNTEC